MLLLAWVKTTSGFDIAVLNSARRMQISSMQVYVLIIKLLAKFLTWLAAQLSLLNFNPFGVCQDL